LLSECNKNMWQRFYEKNVLVNIFKDLVYHILLFQRNLENHYLIVKFDNKKNIYIYFFTWILNNRIQLINKN